LNGCDLQRFERSDAVERLEGLERLERTDPRWDRELSQIINTPRAAYAGSVLISEVVHRMSMQRIRY
jgi:hypothetical protein